jgi:hypothetical protein
MTYVFAHLIMPGIFQKNASHFFEELRNDLSFNTIRRLTETTVKSADKERYSAFLKTIEIHHYSHEHLEAYILGMPIPHEVTEPYFIALTRQVEAKSRMPNYRYVLLEASVDSSGNEVALLCEWIKGRHMILSQKTTDVSLINFKRMLTLN